MLAAAVPASLGLAGLAAAPVLIHLLTRRRVRREPFPALAFLARAEHGRARRARLRDRIILALRCLALLCAALAAAGLAWRGSLGGSGRSAVIILDASASMRQVADGATVFNRARATAGRLLDELEGRPLALVLADQLSTRSGRPERRTGRLRSLIAEAAPGWGDGDPAAAISAAAAALGDEGGDCFLVTDLARGCLAGVDPAALPRQMALQVVDCGGGGDNCAVTGITVEPGVVVVGRPATITARLANFGVASATLSAVLRVAAHQELATVTLAGGATAEVRLRTTFDSSGSWPVEASFTCAAGHDALPDDDHRWGALTVEPALTAVIVSDADREDAAGPVRPLAAALTAAGLAPRLTDSAGLAAECAVRHPALVASVGLASAAAAPALARHLADGGAWLQAVASDGDAAIALPATVPPVVLGGSIDVSHQDRGQMAIAQANLDHALLTPFAGRELLLTSLAAYRYRLTPQAPAADATVLLAYGDGTVAMAERPVGNGRWLLLNGSPAAADSNLASSDALPLIAARLPEVLLPSRSVQLARDAGSWIASTTPLSDDQGRTWPQVQGRVRALAPGILRAPGGALSACAIPALESDLRRLDPAVLGLTAIRSDDAVSLATTTPLWPWLVAAALLCLALELLIAGGLPAGSRR